MPPTLVSIDPNTPPGSQSLKQGPARFHEIKNAILQILGFTGVAFEQFGAPFTFSDPGNLASGLLDVAGQPLTDLGIATKSYVDQHSGLNIVLTSTDGANYTSNVPAALTLTDGSIYVLGNNTTNTGPVTATVGTLTLTIKHANLGALAAGDFLQATNYIAVFDSSNSALVLLDFIGGSVSQPITLPANPTQALQAATKQYVDTSMSTQTYIPLTSSVALPQNTITDVFNTAITLPTDNNNYMLMASYGLWVDEDVTTDVIQVAAWVEANTNGFALGGAHLVTQGTGIVNASGICQTVFPSSTTIITLTLRVQPVGGNMHAFVTSPKFVGAPQSFLTWALLRTS